MRTLAWVGIALAPSVIGMTGCGKGGAELPLAPGPTDVRNFYALNGGNCWFYQSGLNVTRTAVDGPNTTSIANETVYVWRFQPLGGGQPQEWFLDTEKNAEIRLLRATEGIGEDRVTKRFETSDAPLFLRLRRNFTGALVLDDSRFTVETTPEECGAGQNGTCEPGNLEKHEWVVLQSEVNVETPLGTRQGMELEYRLQSSAESRSPRYTFVPEVGFTQIIDSAGTTFALCSLYVCDEEGGCEGNADCSGPAICSSG